MIDPGLMRPGRFDRHIEVGTPNEEGRLSIFKYILKICLYLKMLN